MVVMSIFHCGFQLGFDYLVAFDVSMCWGKFVSDSGSKARIEDLDKHFYMLHLCIFFLEQEKHTFANSDLSIIRWNYFYSSKLQIYVFVFTTVSLCSIA